MTIGFRQFLTTFATLPRPSRAAQPEPPSYYNCCCCCYCWECWRSRRPAPPSLPAATTIAAVARATAAAGGGAAGSTGGAASVGAARGGQQRSLHLPDDPTPQQLREWVVQQGSPGGGGFGFMWPQRLRDCACQRCVPSRVEAAALGSSESAVAPGAGESAAALGARESAVALGASASTTTGLDSGASRCFFRDCTTVTPLAAPVPVSLADPTGGPIVARASTVLSCPAVPSGSLSDLHLLAFSTNLLSNAVLQDEWVDTFIHGGQRVAICKVAASSRVSASGQLASTCSCRVLSHHTLLWHHRLGHPSLPCLQSMHSHLLVSGLLSPLPSLPRSPASPCLPCVEGRHRAAPHSSEFPPTTAPLQTLHMDVWGPTPVGGANQERYFLLVVDEYTRYTTVFPLWRKVDISGVLIPRIRAIRHQLRERFRRDFPDLRLHSHKGSEFSFDLLADYCRDESIRQSFTLPASPQRNGIAERRIGLIMEVARTSMIHASAPHFLWSFAVRYAANQLNLWPRVFEPETSPTLRWMGMVGDASVFWVWGALSLVRDAKASKLSSRTLRCEISSDSSGPAERGDPAADDTAAIRCSPRLKTSPGFPPRPSSPPPQPAAVESGAETAGAKPRGSETEGEGSGGASTGGAGSGGVATGGADSGGVANPSGGGAVGDPAGGPGVGSPGGGGYVPAGAGAASPGGTTGAGGTGGTAGGAAGAGGTRGAAGAGGAKATSPRGAIGAGGAGPTSPGGIAGAGGAAGARGAGAGGTRGAGAAGPRGARTGAGAAEASGVVSARGARTRGTGVAGASGAASAGGATGDAGTGGAGAVGTGGAGAAGTGGARTRGAGAAGVGGAASAGGAGGATGAVGSGGAGGTTGAGGIGAGGNGGNGGTGGAGGVGPGGARTRDAGAAGAGGAAGVGGAGGATGATGTGGARGNAGARGAGAAGTRSAAGAGDATGGPPPGAPLNSSSVPHQVTVQVRSHVCPHLTPQCSCLHRHGRGDAAQTSPGVGVHRESPSGELPSSAHFSVFFLHCIIYSSTRWRSQREQRLQQQQANNLGQHGSSDEVAEQWTERVLPRFHATLLSPLSPPFLPSLRLCSSLFHHPKGSAYYIAPPAWAAAVAAAASSGSDTGGGSCSGCCSSNQGSQHHPIMGVHERCLSLLAWRSADEVVLDAPWAVSDQLDKEQRYAAARARGMVRQVQSAAETTTTTIVSRVVDHHHITYIVSKVISIMPTL
ncbi:unnamed protein product [Closterium sp. NIES-54]